MWSLLTKSTKIRLEKRFIMIRTLHAKTKHVYKIGQIVSVYNTMPDKKKTEKYKIIKLIRYRPADELGEYQVKPINVSKDPGNLTDKDGKPSKGLR